MFSPDSSQLELWPDAYSNNNVKHPAIANRTQLSYLLRCSEEELDSRLIEEAWLAFIELPREGQRQEPMLVLAIRFSVPVNEIVQRLYDWKAEQIVEARLGNSQKKPPTSVRPRSSFSVVAAAVAI